jgi:nitrite reductase/ring-hydroxylating ferredoxin subunit
MTTASTILVFDQLPAMSSACSHGAEAPTRRHILKLLGTAVAGCGAVAAGATLGGCSSRVTGPVVAGNVSKFPVGYFGFPGTGPYALGRDANGFYAVDAVCPHEDVDMSTNGRATAAGLVCGRHQAAFSTEGVVTKGPATSNLPSFKVDIAADGNVTVQLGTEVAAAMRTKSPV